MNENQVGAQPSARGDFLCPTRSNVGELCLSVFFVVCACLSAKADHDPSEFSPIEAEPTREHVVRLFKPYGEYLTNFRRYRIVLTEEIFRLEGFDSVPHQRKSWIADARDLERDARLFSRIMEVRDGEDSFDVRGGVIVYDGDNCHLRQFYENRTLSDVNRRYGIKHALVRDYLGVSLMSINDLLYSYKDAEERGKIYSSDLPFAIHRNGLGETKIIYSTLEDRARIHITFNENAGGLPTRYETFEWNNEANENGERQFKLASASETRWELENGKRRVHSVEFEGWNPRAKTRADEVYIQATVAFTHCKNPIHFSKDYFTKSAVESFDLRAELARLHGER